MSWPDLHTTLATADLTMPEYFQERFPTITKVGSWTWSTSGPFPAEEEAYMLRSPSLWAAGRRDPHLRFCHAGHGVNSYALTLELVLPRVAIFTQVGWGGVYMDNALRAAANNVRLAQAAELARMVESVPAWPGEPVMVVASDMRGGSAVMVGGVDVAAKAPPFLVASQLVGALDPSYTPDVDWSNTPM